MKKFPCTIFIIVGLTLFGFAQARQPEQVEPTKQHGQAEPAKPSDQAKPAESAQPGSAPDSQVPSLAFKDVQSLKLVGNPIISPDGKDILFTVRQADWEKNRYDTEI